MKPAKRPDCRPYLLIGWWLFWLVMSQTPLNIAVSPSPTAVLHFVVLLLAFAEGFAFIRLVDGDSASMGPRSVTTLPYDSRKLRWLVYGFGSFATVLLIVALYLSGAVTTSFLEYFAKLRMGAQEAGPLTGIKPLDTLTKAFAFPVSYGLLLVVLAGGVKAFKPALTICLLNFALYAYLWQVNYPIVHLFWLAFFYLVSRFVDGFRIDRRTLTGLALAFGMLVLSAMNRFGSNEKQLFGAARVYVAGYHLIGFSFYDYQLANPHSILHTHSFGRSSLGFLDLLVELVARKVGVDYVAASSENSVYNDVAVPIGVGQLQDFNAFGTLAFSFYRDLGVVGIALGGFLYGGAIAYGLLNLRRNWMAGGMFYLLASAWMMGMMVSPVEQTYFWFCLVFLVFARLASRPWGIFPSPAGRQTSMVSVRRRSSALDREAATAHITAYRCERPADERRISS